MAVHRWCDEVAAKYVKPGEDFPRRSVTFRRRHRASPDPAAGGAVVDSEGASPTRCDPNQRTGPRAAPKSSRRATPARRSGSVAHGIRRCSCVAPRDRSRDSHPELSRHVEDLAERGRPAGTSIRRPPRPTHRARWARGGRVVPAHHCGPAASGRSSPWPGWSAYADNTVSHELNAYRVRVAPRHASTGVAMILLQCRATASYTSTGPEKPSSVIGPSFRNSTSRSPASSATSPLTRVCPPAACSAIRAARLTTLPK
jgi:hypothetical protein